VAHMRWTAEPGVDLSTGLAHGHYWVGYFTDTRKLLLVRVGHAGNGMVW